MDQSTNFDIEQLRNARLIWQAECHYTLYNYKCPLIAKKGQYYTVFKDNKGILRVAKVKTAVHFYLEEEMVFVYQSQPS